jgi:hypothetical protein
MSKQAVNMYLNTSRFTGGAWIPSVSGFDLVNNIFCMEVFLDETAEENWERFKEKFKSVSVVNKRGFVAAFNRALEETRETARRTR